MSSETHSFFLLLCGVTALCAGLLFLTWRQYRPSPALGGWTAAYALATVALLGTVERGGLPYVIGVALPGALLIAAFGLLWEAIRTLRGAARRPILAALPALCWFGLTLLPPLRHDLAWRIAAMGPLVGAGVLAITLELWRLPRILRMRLPLFALFVCHAGFYLLRTAAVLFRPLGLGGDGLFRATAAEAVAFAVADSFLLMSLVREGRERDIERASRTDFLTGVLNRSGFDAAATRLLARAARHRSPCALLLLDLDHFKQVNDRDGHPAGDAVLRHLAASCRVVLRPYDVLARIGGDEFAVLVEKVSAADAALLAARLAHRFAAAAGGTSPATVSIGIACSPVGATPLDALLADADRSLYVRKAARTPIVPARSPRPGESAIRERSMRP